ncbi:MAG: hypothetical protein ACLGIA_04770, partial [Actinomycetes bacterium]
MNGLMSSAMLVARGVGAAAEAGVKMVADAVLPPALKNPPRDQASQEAVADMERQVAALRQRVLHLEGRLAAAEARSTTPQATVRTAKKAPATKKTSARRSTAKTAESASPSPDAPPSPEETSGIPDTPATVAERASITKPAE